MPFDERRIDDVTILDFKGRLTFSAGAELSRRIRVLTASRTTKVVLSLERVTYLDSAGLGFLVSAFTDLRGNGGVLKFVNPTVRTQHVLEITGIATLVETFPSEAAAVASFGVSEAMGAAIAAAQ